MNFFQISSFFIKPKDQPKLPMFIDNIRKALDQNKYTDAAFIDLYKDFIIIWHRIIQAKLPPDDVKEQELEQVKINFLIISKLFGTKTVVSAEQCLESGVPQRLILGPIVFLVKSNDLAVYRSNAL